MLEQKCPENICKGKFCLLFHILISYAERQRSPDGAPCATYGATPCSALWFYRFSSCSWGRGTRVKIAIDFCRFPESMRAFIGPSKKNNMTFSAKT